MKIDLHVHTYFSDGSYSPREVVEMAVEREVSYLAICDHDVISGVEEAQRVAEGKNIKVISGTEVTCKVDCSDKEVHLVGLYVDVQDQHLKSFSEEVQRGKLEKAKSKIAMLNKNLNANLTLEDIRRKTKGIPSSAHIWMVLVERGLAKNIKEGRDIAVKYGGVPEDNLTRRIHAREAIKMIHDSGGTAVLAHLAVYKNEGKFKTFSEQETLVRELVSYGLDGLEIYIPEANEEEIKFGEKIANKYHLKLSVGSDFHDEAFIPQNKIGFLDIHKSKITVLRD